MLEIRNLHKEYGKTVAVEHISFQVNDGEVAVILGPNGAGKSTTIQSVVGILRYDGEIFLDGVSTKSPKAKSKIAYVPEIPALFPLLTVREHVIYMAKAYSIDYRESDIDHLLERFEMLDKQDKLGDELSKGMMQKVSICAALITNPDVLILDEPMVGLDPKAIRELKDLIHELKAQGKTILLSTHMLDMVDSLWDRVIMIQEGRVVGNYHRGETSSEDLEALYFSITGKEGHLSEGEDVNNVEA